MKNHPPIVLITGAARSGTSMVAGALEACGLDLGKPLVGKSKWNPEGFKEHKHLRQKVLKPLLRELNADPRGQRTLPPRGVMVPPGRAARLRRAVRSRLNGARGWKDAKILLVWPIFKAAFPDARWVIVRRDRNEIVDSCIRCDFMKGRTYKAGWLAWMAEHELRMDDLKASGVQWVECWPDPTEPESFREAAEFCGLNFDPLAVQATLRPEAWHRRRKAKKRR